VRCVFGTEACDISLLFFLTYIAAAGGLDALLSARKNHGAQELKVVVSTCSYFFSNLFRNLSAC
jgi:hypothetical protein